MFKELVGRLGAGFKPRVSPQQWGEDAYLFVGLAAQKWAADTGLPPSMGFAIGQAAGRAAEREARRQALAREIAPPTPEQTNRAWQASQATQTA